MELWIGSLRALSREIESRALSGKMLAAYFQHHRSTPSEGELASWEKSLPALSVALLRADVSDLHVALEYHLPLSGRRLDAVVLGKSKSGAPRGLVVELKQWSSATLQ